MTVVAAVDNSAAARNVLRTALAAARLTGDAVTAFYVREDDGHTAAAAAAACRVPFREVRGDVVEQLLTIADAPDTEALVVGARGRPTGARPAGHVVLGVMTRITKPLIVVPPQTAVPDRIRRLLVPLDGTIETAHALGQMLEIAADADIEIIALHVCDDASIPLFSDQPQHETQAFGEEFLARYAGAARGAARLELRVGVPAEHVHDVATELDVDLIALGWSQRFEPGRAQVVRRLVETGAVPIELIPLAAPPAPAGAHI